jgi:hypothetical protein
MNPVRYAANLFSPRQMLPGKLARIVDGASACASSVMNQYKGCSFGVLDVGMGGTWNTLFNGLEVEVSIIMGRPSGSIAQRAVATDAISCKWLAPFHEQSHS